MNKRTAMVGRVIAVVLTILIAETALPRVLHAKDPWKDYYKAQAKQEKADRKFRRKQAHEWEKYQRKQAKHWKHDERGSGRYGW